MEKLCSAAQDDLSLGLLNPSVARELGRLPVGNQEELLIAIRRDGLSTTEVRHVVDLLIGCTTREQREYVLLKPREAVREATGGSLRLRPAAERSREPLSPALGRASGRPGLDGDWLRHSGRAELSRNDGQLLRGGLERFARMVTRWPS